MFECLQLKVEKSKTIEMQIFILGMKDELKRLKRNQASKKKRLELNQDILNNPEKYGVT